MTHNPSRTALVLEAVEQTLAPETLHLNEYDRQERLGLLRALRRKLAAELAGDASTAT